METQEKIQKAGDGYAQTREQVIQVIELGRAAMKRALPRKDFGTMDTIYNKIEAVSMSWRGLHEIPRNLPQDRVTRLVEILFERMNDLMGAIEKVP